MDPDIVMDAVNVCRQLRGCRQNSDIPGQLLENLVKTPHGPYTPCNITQQSKQFGWPTGLLVIRAN